MVKTYLIQKPLLVNSPITLNYTGITMSDNTLKVAILIFNFAIIAGAATLCAVYEWSLWTIFFAVLFLVDYRYDDSEDQKP